MKPILTNLIIIVLLFLQQAIMAQPLNELIATAMENNYQIKIVKNEAQIAENNNTAGNAGQLPTVHLNGGVTYSLNNTQQKLADGSIREGSNAQTSNFNLALLANWTLFDGFRVYAKKDQLSYLEQIGALNSKYYIEQTIADITMVYFQLLFEKQVLESYKQSMKISNYRLQLEEKRKKIGSGRGIDYNQALIDYQTDSILFLSQLNTIKLLEIEINRVLNTNDLEQPISITDTSYSILEIPNKSDLLNTIKDNNRLLEINRLNELISETELRMAQANRHPTISLFAGYQYNESFAEVGFISANRNIGPTAGINIQFNLYNGGNTNRTIQNNIVSTENSKLTTTQVQQDMRAQALSLYQQHTSLASQIILASNNEKTNKKVYHIASKQLEQGTINGYDFRLTQLALLNAELTLKRLQFTQKTAEINLNRLSGSILDAYL